MLGCSGYSNRSYTELRLFLKEFNVQLPTRNNLDVEKSKLHPTITVEQIKSSVNYQELVEDTVKGESQSN